MGIAILCGNQTVGEALASALDQGGGFDICGIASHIASVKALADLHEPDLLLVTQDVVDQACLKLLRGMRGHGAPKMVLLYGGPPPDRATAEVFDSLHAGSAGMFPLCQRLRLLAPTRRSQDPSAHDDGAVLETNARQALPRGLSPKELEISQLLAQGRTNRQIARVIGLAEPSVKAYVGRLLRSFECENRVQLALKLTAAGSRKS